ncbi:MAG: hemolysin III family protein [Deltaproteobacteria bacterium]|nr:hemolysin III family protein [Deltaproteobacteria bacterium]
MSSLSSISAAKPRLRGRVHQVSFFLAVLAGVVLFAHVTRPAARAACAVYVASLVGLLGTSALYHRVDWSDVARRRMRRLDHAAIFVLIAGTYTPIAMTLPPEEAHRVLVFAWVGAVLGAIRAIFWIGAPKGLVAALALLMGWFVVGYLPAIHSATGATVTLLIGAGGALYTAGALIYAFKRPNPWPATFGYHEIFHSLVVVAAAAHFVAVAISLENVASHVG